MNLLERDVKYLKGVGDARAKLLASELDIHTVRDLLYHFPTRHIDRSRFYAIRELSGEMPYVQVKGSFVSFNEEGEGARKRLRAVFTDGRSMMECVWFSKIDYFKKAYQRGKEYVIFGKPTYYNLFQMSHPEVEEYDPAKPPQGSQGIYPMTETLRKRGFSMRLFRTAIAAVIDNPAYDTVPDNLPAEIVDHYRLMPLKDALYQIHFPENPQKLQRARERLKFEELFYLQLNILRFARERSYKIQGHTFSRIGEYFNDFFHNHIPFSLTGAQKRVLKEIRADMATGMQMNRLLQGDVGSGKTMVAFMTMLMAIDNGFQAAIMAPTEILATQHYESIKAWCDALGLQVRLLTGSTRTKARREIHETLENGTLNIIVGTHALLEDKVRFHRLGLAVIDEQHRFGVAQRARMWGKNEVPPHVLVMTATPIPRTLAMTVYGDLEVSVIDELPPGRKPVETLLRFDDNRNDINRLIASQLREGRQVYIVYPLVHENEKLSLKSVEEGFERISALFKDYSVSMVHGQLKPVRKDAEMQKFVSGESRIMVATTVIEVGVNVPNATVMVIENAERFGLSQLHQLRGRVGRGADRSYCVLVTKQSGSADTRRRLNVMVETTDGFLISEADMKMRGPGDMEGTQQSGISFALHIADLTRDGQIMTPAREAARRILDEYPQFYVGADKKDIPISKLLSIESLNTLNSELRRRFAKSADWSQIS